MNVEELVKGKNVILAGPSGNLKEDCKDIKVDEYDVVVRLNKHWKIKKTDQTVLGRRTDILYHCMNIDQYNESDIKIWKEKNIYLVFRNDFRVNNRHHIKWKEWQKRNRKVNFDNFSFNDGELFFKYKKEIGCNPSTGVLCMFYLLSFELESLSVVGFDFYKTLYTSSNIEGREGQLLTKIQKGLIGDHKPDMQLEYIKKVRKNYPKLKPLGMFKKLLGE